MGVVVQNMYSAGAAAVRAGHSPGQGGMFKLKICLNIYRFLMGESVLPPDQHVSLIYRWTAAGGTSGQGGCRGALTPI